MSHHVAHYLRWFTRAYKTAGGSVLHESNMRGRTKCTTLNHDKQIKCLLTDAFKRLLTDTLPPAAPCNMTRHGGHQNG
jgi:hypothetical protein